MTPKERQLAALRIKRTWRVTRTSTPGVVLNFAITELVDFANALADCAEGRVIAMDRALTEPWTYGGRVKQGEHQSSEPQPGPIR